MNTSRSFLLDCLRKPFKKWREEFRPLARPWSILPGVIAAIVLGTSVSMTFAQKGGFNGYVAPLSPTPTSSEKDSSNSHQNTTPAFGTASGTSSAALPQTSSSLPGQNRPANNSAWTNAVPQTAPSFLASTQPIGSTLSQDPQTTQLPPGQQAPQNVQTSDDQVPNTDAAGQNAAQPDATETSNSNVDPATQRRVLPPPEGFQLSEIEQVRLDEFLQHWENFGKGIKRLACNVHVLEYDGGIFQKDAKTPLSHTWGQFKFIAKNKISYHVRGEFSYADVQDGSEPKWLESSKEWKFVYDGKSMTHYDYDKTTATVIPIVESEWDQDLTLESPFPLFFVANAQNLKDRFYLRIITKPERAQSEVWIEAAPRYSEDAGEFKSIIITLKLKDLQPYYLRKYGVNGKSYTDFKFEDIVINKGLWNIDANVGLTWTKKVEDVYSFKQGRTQNLSNPSRRPESPAAEPVLQKDNPSAAIKPLSLDASKKRF